jgi:hypothetical protein
VDTAPDLVSAIEAWRTWLVVRTRDGLRLGSVMYASCWIPRRAMQASCRPQPGGWPGLVDSGRRSHDSPAGDCRCGLYGAIDLAEAARYLDTVGPVGEPVAWSVIGKVSLWGTVVEATAGYRASHAYPSALYVPARRLFRPRAGRELPDQLTATAVARSLAAYGVPVTRLQAATPLEVADDLQQAA